MECSVSTIAGGSGNSIFFPRGIAIDEDGNLFIADSRNQIIFKISSIGVVTTIAGNGTVGYKDGDGINSKFNYPEGVAIDNDGNIVIADNGNHRIRKISLAGHVTTVAGNGTPGYLNGDRITAKFNFPSGVATDKDGNIFIADNGNHRIRKINLIGHVSTVAGKCKGYQDGVGINSKFFRPTGIAIDKDGFIFVADCYNHRIRKVSGNGVVTTFAGDGTAGYQDGDGINSKFNYPFGIAIDNNGNIFVTDKDNHRIRKISSLGHVTTVAGDGTNGYFDGNGKNSKFSFPLGIAVDKDGCNIFVTDYLDNRIRHINLPWDKIITKWPRTHSLLNEISSLKNKKEHIFSLLFVLKNYTDLPGELNPEIVKIFLWVEFFRK